MMDSTRRAHSARSGLSGRGAATASAPARGGLFVLSRGAQGPQVVALRELLTRAGYLSERATAVFDAQTASALAAFQRDAQLNGTGRLDRLTQLALRASVAASQEDALVERALALLRRHAALSEESGRNLTRWKRLVTDLSKQQRRCEVEAKGRAANAQRARANAHVKAREAAAARVRREARAKAAARARILAAAKAFVARRVATLAKLLAAAHANARKEASRPRTGRA